MMDHFYLSKHGDITYLVERSRDEPWLGYVVRRLT